jgi:hypothetical protein
MLQGLSVLLLQEVRHLLLLLPVVVLLQVARRLVQRRWLLIRLEGRPLGSEWRRLVLASQLLGQL